ncbi:MAG TPA: TraB/GumN family protein [Candidatus Woesearchaeota archaeon]|nr:TraB/GumN family protein [Candidatus Woesearchaeota archaeon]
MSKKTNNITTENPLQIDPYIRIIGTSHIASLSLDQIRNEFYQFSPDVIGVELDLSRAKALFESSKQKEVSTFQAVRAFGLFGGIFFILGKFLQKKLGNLVGTNPGSEMKLGITLAKERNLPVLLLDRDITITMKRLSKKMRVREIFKIIIDLIFAPFSNKKIKIDLSKVPESDVIEQLITSLKKRYPTIYTVLIEERNIYMSTLIKRFKKENPHKKLLVIVGAGHENWIRKDISSQE